MSTHDDQTGDAPDDLVELDRVGASAATGLRSHVAAHLDVEAALGILADRRPRRRVRMLTAAAALLLLVVGAVAVLEQDTSNRVEVDGDDPDRDGRDLPDLEPGVLTPLGPRDGKDSIRLPLTSEPSTDLVDGQAVTVSGSGFQPGEGVGLVQCAKEAGGDSPELRAGIQGCYIGGYTSLTADDAGVATGTYEVHRLLTTPLTGTIDCAAEAERCMVAMGALADYDRSGTHPIVFDADVEPVDLPTITVTPTDGLTDGAVVHVVAEGLTPGDRLYGEVCSSDPQACTSAALRADGPVDEAETRSMTTDSRGVEVFEIDAVGLLVDSRGRAEGDLTVWQYLPGADPGTYVDCAVSHCSLRLGGQTAPPTVPLAFLPGEGPVAPNAVVEPADGLAVGDEVVVRGTGFRPGTAVMLTLCAHRGDSLEEGYLGCAYNEGEELLVAGDGTITIDYVIPEVRDETHAMACRTEEECRNVQPGPPVRCGVDGVECELRVEAYIVDGGPTFLPPPMPVTFR